MSSSRAISCRYIFRGELNDRRWKRRRSVENAAIIGTMFRLLYKHRPSRLLDVLDMARKCIGEGVSKDEATLQDLQVRFMTSIYPRTKETLF